MFVSVVIGARRGYGRPPVWSTQGCARLLLLLMLMVSCCECACLRLRTGYWLRRSCLGLLLCLREERLVLAIPAYAP